MKTTRKEAIAKTTKLLNMCREAATKGSFNPKHISRFLKTSNTTFYAAIELGYFEKNSIGNYVSKVKEFNEVHSQELLKFMSNKQTEAKKKRATEFDQTFVFDLKKLSNLTSYSTEELIKELKRRGYNGHMKKSETIEF